MQMKGGKIIIKSSARAVAEQVVNANIYIDETGTIVSAADMQDTLPYDPGSSLEILSDGTIHVWQNFYDQVTNNLGLIDPNDFTSIIGFNDIDALSGVFPTNIRSQLEEPGSFHQTNSSVYNNTANDYGAERFGFVESSVSPTAIHEMNAFGVNTNGDYNTALSMGPAYTILSWDGIDDGGSLVAGTLSLNPNNERTGIQRLEGVLEQDISSFGSSSTFGERVTRVFHTINEIGIGGSRVLHRLEIRDDQFDLVYGQNRADGRRRLRLNSNDSFLDRQFSGGVYTLGLDDDGGFMDGGDFEINDIGSGVIIASPNGTRFRITVNNAGALITTSL